MDLKRNVLIAGLAIISYFLLLAWNDDYPKQTVQTQLSSQSSPALNDIASDLPANIDIQNTPNVENSDLPQVVSAASNSAPVATFSNASSLITITTPVQVISIDLSGGDIVDLALPEYPVSLEAPNEPFVLLKNNNGVYIAQSGLIGADGPDANASGRPLYQSSQKEYLLSADQGELSVDLQFTDQNGVNITKRFTFSANDYLVKIQYVVNNQSETTWNGNIFGQIKRDNATDPSSTGSGMGMGTYLGAVLTVPDDNYKKVDFDEMDDNGSNDTVLGGWIGFSQHYFISSWIPDSETTNTYTTRKNSTGDYIMGFVGPITSVAAGSSQTIEANFWAGPKDQYRLEEVSPNLGLTIDYGFLWFVAQPIFWILFKINNYLGNFGWSIIGMTLVIKVGFSWLSAGSYRSMAKMRRLAPKIAQLKDRYGDDKQKIMQEQMALWKKEKVNPLGGCLPMLIQMPVLMGIYWVLNESVELRQAPWTLWYNDLSVSDPYFILPLVMGASMFVSQLMTPMTTADPMQAKVMKFMPVIFTGFFLWFPSGLVLYWLVSNLFNIAQQYYINKKVNESYDRKKS